MADPYQVLGVTSTAPLDDIRKAYRRLAKKNHPDLHPGDKGAEARFKDIATAYGIVGDDVRRTLFDSGKIDATGAETPQPQPQPAGRPSYREQAEAQPGFKYDRRWNGGGADEDDLFAELFGQRARGPARGADVSYSLSVDFIEAVAGAKKRVVMADGRTLDITIPAGLSDGQTLRLRGQGQPGASGGETGDVMVVIHVKPHPVFQRDGTSIRSTLPVTLAEALAGTKIAVETVSGPVTLVVPKGSTTGTTLRLKGRGVPSKSGAGDHYIEIKVVLPPVPDDDLVAVIVAWEAKHPYDPRAGGKS